MYIFASAFSLLLVSFLTLEACGKWPVYRCLLYQSAVETFAVTNKQWHNPSRLVVLRLPRLVICSRLTRQGKKKTTWAWLLSSKLGNSDQEVLPSTIINPPRMVAWVSVDLPANHGGIWMCCLWLFPVSTLDFGGHTHHYHMYKGRLGGQALRLAP